MLTCMLRDCVFLQFENIIGRYLGRFLYVKENHRLTKLFLDWFHDSGKANAFMPCYAFLMKTERKQNGNGTGTERKQNGNGNGRHPNACKLT